MKKIFLFLAFVLTVSVASAWRTNCEEGIVIMAAQHFAPRTKAVVERYLGTKYADDVLYLNGLESKKKAKHTKEIHYVHLDASMQPMKVEGDDALVALEEALAVVAAYETRSDEEMTAALRTVINLMSDIHHLSNYRIASIPYSLKTYKFKRQLKDYGKDKEKAEITLTNWHRVWSNFSSRYTGFSGEFWAYEMNLAKGKMKEEYSKGTLRDWISENGETAAMYLNRFHPDYVVSPFEFNSLEEVNYAMMVRASFRLAAILNSTIK